MKRTPIVRKTPLRAKPADGKPSPKPVKCKAPGCSNRFVRRSITHKACGPDCAAVLARLVNEKAAARAALDDRKKTRAQLEALKTIPQLKKEAQQAFNAFIRARDRAAGYDCISSGRPLDWGTAGITGSKVDAGHYRSTGSADHLRFNEDNCHAQSVSENRDKAGNAVAYRIGLIKRIGLARVEALECNNEVVKWTREMLREIRDTYRLKARALEKGAANDPTMQEAA